MNLTFTGRWPLPNKTFREFRLELPDGRCANFTVGPSDCLKTKLAEIQQKFANAVRPIH